MDTEFWATVINGSSNLVIAGAMVVQTIIFIITFTFGLRELEKHREKIKEENRQKLIIKCLNLIAKLSLGFINFYTFNIDEVFDEKDPKKVEDFIDRNLKEYIVRQNNYPKLNEQFLLLESYFEILEFPKGIESFKQASKVLEALENQVNEIIFLRKENDYFKAFIKIKNLGTMNFKKDQKSKVYLLFLLFSLMRKDLLNSYKLEN